MSQTFRLVKYENDILSRDFNGKESTFSIENQIDYLKTFYNEYKKFNNFSDENRLIGETDIDECVKNLKMPDFSFRKRLYFADFKAQFIYENNFKHLFLYRGVSAFDNKFDLLDDPTLESPAIEIIDIKDIAYFDFDFNISKEYYSKGMGPNTVMDSGKTIEFRNDISEVFKLQFYNNGTLDARIIENDIYHHKNIRISRYEFDSLNHLSIKFKDSKVILKFNNDEEISLKLKYDFYPNNIFIGSGIHPIGKWSLSNITLKNIDYKIVNIFEKEETLVKEDEISVKIPYIIGTFKNKRKQLVISKEFEIKKEKDRIYKLNISTIDPSGSIYINNNLVKHIANYLSISLDVTDYLHDGINFLSISINPRPPENFVSWHRNKDPFYGWCVGEIYLDSLYSESINNVKIETIDFYANKIDFKVDVDIDNARPDTMVKIEIKDKEVTSEVTVDHIEYFDSRITIYAQFNGKLWSPNQPNLYDIKIKLYFANLLIDEYALSYGFRILKSIDGHIELNKKDFIPKGFLLMQYLAPYEDIVLNHICPSLRNIVREALEAKALGANTIRMHQIGYGTNDTRFLKVFDYLGLTVIWTTRSLDSIYLAKNDGIWPQKEMYKSQVRDVYNYASIICFEGTNEEHLARYEIDNIVKAFVNGVKEVDKTRLLSPISHMYYANDSYDLSCEYYQDDGIHDEYFKKVYATKEWNDELILRSSHAYNWTLGYGCGFEKLRKQDWSGFNDLVKSKKHPYVIAEYAVIGRQNPNIKEEFINNDSYEYKDEEKLGYYFTDNTYYLSQSYQALSVLIGTLKMLSLGVDGMLYCALNGGANDGSYLKPLIDFNGHPKLGACAIKEAFTENIAFLDDTDLILNKTSVLKPVVLTNIDNCFHNVFINIYKLNDELVDSYLYENVLFCNRLIKLKEIKTNKLTNDYYKIIIKVE